MKVSEIVVGERFRKDIGDLTSLVRSIREVGLLHPIVVSEKGELIAGLRRLKAFQVMGLLDIPATVINLSDLRKGEIQENLIRKNFITSEMVAVKRALEPEVKAEAKERQGIRTDLGHELLPKLGRSSDIIASFARVSHGTMEKAEAIVEAAEKDPEQFKPILVKVDDGKLSIDAGFRKIKRLEKPETPAMPMGSFDVIYADPPWAYEVNYLSASPEQHYPTMKTEEIMNLKIPSSENCILFLWATNPLLEEALKVMGAWGFKYKTNLVWIKSSIGLGYYFRGQHELLLLGVKGDVHPPAEHDRIPSVLMAVAEKHSAKPERIYQLIERMYPNAKYLELFAREKRENWISWGNEI